MATETSAATVSTALKGSNGDLINTINALSATWAADVQSAKTRARDLHGAVLHERQSLQESLGSAARLWSVLRAPTPSDCHLESETASQRAAAVALRNVTQAVQYLDFFDGIPAALEEARATLLRIIDDGATKFVAGNASALYNAHAMLAAVERVRDVTVLETLYRGEGAPASAPEPIPLVDDTRAQLDDFLFRGVFSDILSVSQSNPRFLVSAIRVVLQEEERDAWREQRMASLQLRCVGSGAGALPLRVYKPRFFDSVATQIDSMFRPIDASLSLHGGDEVAPERPTKPPMAEAVLEWLNERIADNDLVQRFVAPCLPGSFGIAAFYEAKLHHRMMTTLLALLRMITDAGSERARQDDMIKFLLWYSSYRQGVGSDYSGIDSYLDDRDRALLVKFMRQHVASAVGAQVSFVLDADAMSSQGGSFAPLSPMGAGTNKQDGSLSPNIPEAVFGTINEIVGRASALGVRAVQKAVAIGIADSLSMFQSKFAQALSVNAEQPCSLQHPHYVCSVANNMAGCMESAEQLRDSLSSSLSDEDRMDVIAALEKSVEGFRKIAILAVHDLTRGVEKSLLALTGRLFAPHTGTEVMLDIVGTLDDSFQTMSKHLLPLHFEQLASACLRGIVAHYVTPFLLLAHNNSRAVKNNSGENAKRKSSVGLEDRKWVRGRSQSTLRERLEMGGLRTRRQFESSALGSGLLELNSAAVVAQIDKDIENLTTFFQAKVELRQRKQFQTVLEPMHAIRALYKCPATPVDLVEAYQLAKASVRNAMDSLSPKCGPERKNMSVRVAEVIWASRPDVNASVRDEAVLYSRSAGHSGTSSSNWDFHKRTLSASSKFSVDAEDSAFFWSPSVSRRRNMQ